MARNVSAPSKIKKLKKVIAYESYCLGKLFVEKPIAFLKKTSSETRQGRWVALLHLFTWESQEHFRWVHGVKGNLNNKYVRIANVSLQENRGRFYGNLLRLKVHADRNPREKNLSVTRQRKDLSYWQQLSTNDHCTYVGLNKFLYFEWTGCLLWKYLFWKIERLNYANWAPSR